MRDLKTVFQKYVGQSVRDPIRYSHEECRVRSQIELEANNLGMAAVFYSENQAMITPDFESWINALKPKTVKVSLRQSDVYGWKIERFDL